MLQKLKLSWANKSTMAPRGHISCKIFTSANYKLSFHIFFLPLQLFYPSNPFHFHPFFLIRPFFTSDFFSVPTIIFTSRFLFHFPLSFSFPTILLDFKLFLSLPTFFLLPTFYYNSFHFHLFLLPTFYYTSNFFSLLTFNFTSHLLFHFNPFASNIFSTSNLFLIPTF